MRSSSWCSGGRNGGVRGSSSWCSGRYTTSTRRGPPLWYIRPVNLLLTWLTWLTWRLQTKITYMIYLKYLQIVWKQFWCWSGRTYALKSCKQLIYTWFCELTNGITAAVVSDVIALVTAEVLCGVCGWCCKTLNNNSYKPALTGRATALVN